MFDVKIIGEPAPDVSWTFGTKSIQLNSSRRIEDVPYNTKFFNDKPERKDTGTYVITAINKHGQDVAEVEVTVICKHLIFTEISIQNFEITFTFVVFD